MTHVELKEKEKVIEESAKDKPAHTGMYVQIILYQSKYTEWTLTIVYSLERAMSSD